LMRAATRSSKDIFEHRVAFFVLSFSDEERGWGLR
jgi:hypothetical protein